MVDRGRITSSRLSSISSLKEELESIGALSSSMLRGQTQETIAPQEFYNTYIMAFINHIVNGVKTK